MKPGLGYLVSPADDRDFRVDRDETSPRLVALGQWSIKKMLMKALVKSTPSSTDLREHCSPIHNQGSLQSCTAHAGTNLMEFMQRKAHGKHLEMSRLYVYYCTRYLMKGNWLEQDAGAYLRTTMAALRLYGAPPEVFYPYNEAKVNDKPSSMLSPLAEDFEAVQYARLDTGWLDRLLLLERIKQFLANGIPVMCGFSVFSNIAEAVKTGLIPMPAGSLEGGHAIVLVGHDDKREVFRFQNSWGTAWGQEGFGAIPYAYFRRGLAQDVWALLRADFVDMKEFGL